MMIIEKLICIGCTPIVIFVNILWNNFVTIITVPLLLYHKISDLICIDNNLNLIFNYIILMSEKVSLFLNQERIFRLYIVLFQFSISLKIWKIYQYHFYFMHLQQDKWDVCKSTYILLYIYVYMYKYVMQIMFEPKYS